MVKKTLATALTVLMCCYCTALFADSEKKEGEHELRARIDVTGHEKVPIKPDKASKGCHVGNIVWGDGETNFFIITCQSDPLEYKKWTTFTFSFIPQETGEVSINIMSDYSSQPGAALGIINAHWIYYDNIRVSGAKLLNGNFDKINKETNKPKGWICAPENVVKRTSKISTVSGSHMVKAWHNRRVIQTIKVRKGQKVTVSFKAKACKFVPSDQLSEKKQ